MHPVATLPLTAGQKRRGHESWTCPVRLTSGWVCRAGEGEDLDALRSTIAEQEAQLDRQEQIIASLQGDVEERSAGEVEGDGGADEGELAAQDLAT